MGKIDLVDAPASEALLLEDLLLGLPRLVPLARQAAAAGQWLDCLLLLAAIGQVVDDHLHRSRSWPKRITEHLGRSGRDGAAAVRLARRLTGLGGALAAARPGARALAGATVDQEDLVHPEGDGRQYLGDVVRLVERRHDDRDPHAGIHVRRRLAHVDDGVRAAQVDDTTRERPALPSAPRTPRSARFTKRGHFSRLSAQVVTVGGRYGRFKR